MGEDEAARGLRPPSHRATTAFFSPAPRSRTSPLRCWVWSWAGICIRPPGRRSCSATSGWCRSSRCSCSRSRPATWPTATTAGSIAVSTQIVVAVVGFALAAAGEHRGVTAIYSALFLSATRARLSVAGQLGTAAPDRAAGAADQRHLVVGHRPRVRDRGRAGDRRRAAGRLRQRERVSDCRPRSRCWPWRASRRCACRRQSARRARR